MRKRTALLAFAENARSICHPEQRSHRAGQTHPRTGPECPPRSAAWRANCRPAPRNEKHRSLRPGCCPAGQAKAYPTGHASAEIPVNRRKAPLPRGRGSVRAPVSTRNNEPRAQASGFAEFCKSLFSLSKRCRAPSLSALHCPAKHLGQLRRFALHQDRYPEDTGSGPHSPDRECQDTHQSHPRLPRRNAVRQRLA